MFEGEASPGWGPDGMAARVRKSEPGTRKENVFLARPWVHKTWDESEISRTSRASCDDTHLFPFSSVPVDRSASAVLRYGCWPALLSFVTESLCRSLPPLAPTFVRFQLGKIKEKKKEKKKG